MNTVTVNASKKYDVFIGSNLLSNVGTYTASLLKPSKAAIISDSNVYPLYGSVIENSLHEAGIQTVSYIFPAGEASKTGETYLSIAQFLAENHITRSDTLIALGGGVVGDMTGFVAATFLRGISYIQVPTSLLAMVDSSVGGKTAIDLPAGKNLLGAFYQPNLVLCDIETLATLPQEIFRDGCAEIVKYGVLFDADLFEHLAIHGIAFNREMVVSRCVALKQNVVMEDEFDTGVRQKLNLGHTFGHSIESLSHFSVTHGQAVAIGIAIASKAAKEHNICDEDTCLKILCVLDKFNLPTATQYTAKALFSNALTDKKRSGGTINLILPIEVGKCIIQPINISNLQSFIEAGL